MIKLKVFFNDRNSRIYLYLLNHIYWIIIVAKRTSIDEKNNILWSCQHHIVITVQPDDALFIPFGTVSYADVLLLNYSTELLDF